MGIKLCNSSIALEFSPETGALESLIAQGVQFVAPPAGLSSLFTLRFRNTEGEVLEIDSGELGSPRFEQNGDALNIYLDAWDRHQIRIKASVAVFAGRAEAQWHLECEHARKGFLEWVVYPRIVVPKDLVGDNGHSTLFWPAMEGIVVETLRQRTLTNFTYRPAEYPNHGWSGYFPGSAPMQFMASLREGKGLYFAAHDPASFTKEIEYVEVDQGILMIFKTFVGAVGKGTFQLPFPLVTSVFDGDWHDAAELYRTWIRSSGVSLPRPLHERKDLADWIDESPVIVSYPVTGSGHHGGPQQTNEYFPFINAVSAIESCGDRLDSPILALLMHWEGTAPWAPPYVWPPRGGEKAFREFVSEVHRVGHYLGLYCSGIAWTNKAATGDGTYDRTEELERDHLIRHMCRGPKGEYECLICNGDDIRWGYDICAAADFASKVTCEETRKIASSGVDYIQLFDQNLGGAAYQCFDPAHGHSAAPGPWQAAAMRKLLQNIRTSLAEDGNNHVILGCEAGAAEPFIKDLAFNELRYFIGYAIGRPVPAYSYVFHEYAASFMGNGCDVLSWIDGGNAPHNLALRLAYSFAAGDLFMIVLKDGGELHWAWLARWNEPAPPQELHWNFIKHLNHWRRKQGKAFLNFGTMLKPHPVSGTFDVPLPLKSGLVLQYPSVLSSRWKAPDGRSGQFLVNYLGEAQTVEIASAGPLLLYPHPEAAPQKLSGHSIDLPPMSAILIEEA